MEGWLVRGNGDRICKQSAVVCFTGTATLLLVWTGEYGRRLQATATRHEVGLTEHRAVVRQFRTLVNTSLPAASTVPAVHTHNSISTSLYCHQLHKHKLFALWQSVCDLTFLQHWIMQWVTGALFTRIMGPKREADHSTLQLLVVNILSCVCMCVLV